MTINELVNRPTAYSAEDGIAELMMGLYIAVSSAGWMLQQAQPKGSEAAQNYLWIAQAVGLGAALGMWWGREKLKARVAYPRGGYVKLDEPKIAGGMSARTWMAGLLLLGSLALVVLELFYWGAGWMPSWKVVVSTGPIIIAVAYIAGGLQYRLNYMIGVGAIMLAIGAWFWSISTSMQDVAKAMACIGAVLAVTGGIRLWRFIKSHPKPTEGEA